MGGLDRMIASAEKDGIATGDPNADALLRDDPNAIMIGILLDQQIRAEAAFSGPYKLAQRLGKLDMAEIAEMDPERFREVFGQKPAVHRFANMMADRVQKLAQSIQAKYDGDASQIWADGADLKIVEKRAGELPGFGANKVKMMKEVLELFGHRGFP